MSPDPGASFELRRATVRFGATVALSACDLRIDAGERVALVGPSGSGKSTLLYLLNATLRPSEGTVFASGRDLSTLSSGEIRKMRAGIGAVPQDLRLIPNLRVVQNVVTGRTGRMGFLRSLREVFHPSKETVREVYGILERVGIAEKIFERTDRLSGGQQQRVAIARALFQRPGAILADEPVSAVDPTRARDTVELLGEIARERGLTLVVSLHNLELARALFPRIVALRAGSVAFDRPADEISDEDFRRLYELADHEMLGDGC
ncbi:MAG: ATP-binding cassette domain-containing protein [Planctomycetota bacterium]